MNKTSIFLLTLAVGVLFFLVVMKIVGWQRIEEALLLFLSFKGLVILGITFLIGFLDFVRWKFILQKLTGSSKFKELYKVWFAGHAFTYLFTPIAILGGEPVKIYLANKLYALKSKESFASVAIDRILEWTLFLIFTIAGILAFLCFSDFPSRKMGWLVTLSIGGLSALLLFFYFKSLRKESTVSWFLEKFGAGKRTIRNFQNNGNIVFEAEKEIINFLSPKEKVFWRGFAMSFLKYLLCFARAAFLVVSLEGSIPAVKILAAYGFNNLALISPLPATLGSGEAVGALSFELLGLSAGSGAIFAMTLRYSEIVLCLIGVIFMINFTLRFGKEKVLRFIDKRIRKLPD